MASRTAHPYRDTDVIDARAPRFNQATVGTLALVALVTGWWPLLTLLALQLIVGLVFGRRFCLPCVLYFEVVQPLAGEGPIEDARPPRFANMLGAIFLSTASVAHMAGLSAIGWVLGGAVAGLALLAAATGLCVGCEIYRFTARMRGIGSRSTPELDLADLGTTSREGLVVQFTHPLCTDCHSVARKLTDEGRQVVLVDVSRRPDLARKYGIAVVPTALAVGANGRIVERLA